MWSNDHTFVIHAEFLGAGEQRKWTLSFDGERPTLDGTSKEGRDVSIAADAPASH
ncbi:MAG TPA: hypothetical protein VG270_04705 [Pseudolabrys sp.]|jgi:hypothetical protein|nr:hypothetical protein [Pseudolabrys sp.]